MSEIEIDNVKKSQINISTKIDHSIGTKLNSLFQIIFIKSCFLNRNQRINGIIVFFILSLTCWFLMFLTLNKEALPGGVCFSLFVLIISCHIVGYLFELIKMPNLLGKYQKKCLSFIYFFLIHYNILKECCWSVYFLEMFPFCQLLERVLIVKRRQF